MPTPAPEDRSVLTLPALPPDRELRYGDHPDAVVDVRLGGPGAAQRPLVVFVHGGFWRPAYDRVHVRPLTAALADAGWTTAAIEYRRVPGRPDDTVDDVAAAIRFLADAPELAGTCDGRLVLAGHSAGGHLVLQAAADPRTPPLAGVVALAPVADLRLAEELALDGDAVRAFLGGPARERPDLDPVRQPAPATRVTVVHGTDDAIVPLAVGRSYAAAHPAAALVEVEGGHFAVIDPRSAAWPDLLAALSGPEDTSTIVVMGVSGSGKSTVAAALVQRLGWEFAEGDDFHPRANVEKMAAGQPLDDEDRRPWLRTLAGWIGEREAAGRCAIVTCSALKRSYRDLLRDGHPSVWFAHVTVDAELLRERIERRRGHYMPSSLLESQLAALEPLAPDEPGAAMSGAGSPEVVADGLLAALRGAGRPSGGG